MKRFIILLLTTLIIISVGICVVSAETETYDDGGNEYVTTDVQEYVTDPYTPEVTDAQEETYAIETFTTVAETDSTQQSTQNNNTPQRIESLPEVASSELVIPSAVGENIDENEPKLFWGFVAWICIGVGAAVILAVLLTTKTKAYRSGGRKRYSTGDKLSSNKRLLDDKYYNRRR